MGMSAERAESDKSNDRSNDSRDRDSFERSMNDARNETSDSKESRASDKGERSLDDNTAEKTGDHSGAETSFTGLSSAMTENTVQSAENYFGVEVVRDLPTPQREAQIIDGVYRPGVDNIDVIQVQSGEELGQVIPEEAEEETFPEQVGAALTIGWAGALVEPSPAGEVGMTVITGLAGIAVTGYYAYQGVESIVDWMSSSSTEEGAEESTEAEVRSTPGYQDARDRCQRECTTIYERDPEQLPGSGGNYDARMRRCLRECMEAEGYDW